MSGEQVDAFGIRFYGDFEGKIERVGTLSEIISDPDLPPLTKHKRITFWFTLEKIRTYSRVSSYLRELTYILKKEGYAIMVSSLDGLVDTTSPEYADKPESNFPASDRMHGCNAANGFSVTAEKADNKAKFSIKEIEAIQELIARFGQVVYGRPLKKVQVSN